LWASLEYQGVCHAMEFVCLQDQFENAVR